MSSPTYIIPHHTGIGKIKMYLNNEFISCYDKDKEKNNLRYLHFIGDNTANFIKENDELGTFDINLDALIDKMIDDRLSRNKYKIKQKKNLTEGQRLKKNKSSVWLSEDFPSGPTNDK